MSTLLVSNIVSGLKKDKNYFKKAQEKEDFRRSKAKFVIEESKKLTETKNGLLAAKNVVSAVNEKHNIKVTN